MKSNLLGDIRAENDELMLDAAFLETGDYRALFESKDRSIVVGRRGSGKSALVNRLHKQWSNDTKTEVIVITPDEDQVIGLRGIFKSFGTEYVHIKAASKIAWRYALCLELLSLLAQRYKLKSELEKSEHGKQALAWGKDNSSFSSKLRNKLKAIIDPQSTPEDRIADLANDLEVSALEKLLQTLLEQQKKSIVLLIDRLDEGFTPDTMGVAIVDAFTQAATDLNTKLGDLFRSIIFIRDNIFRAIAINDPDFTRNTEGQVLRLHWDDYNLFNLICNRLRVAKNSDQENNTRLWNSYAVRELKGREGFKAALRLTLYRPRDILVLLNNAFLNASNRDAAEITPEDIDSSASSISENRLHDLFKEYEAILPSLELLISSFRGGDSNISVQTAKHNIAKILAKDNHQLEEQRSLSFFEDEIQALQSLYGVGFLGIEDQITKSFVFCHDGREPAKDISDNARLLVHPCYRLALNLSEADLDNTARDEIYDEYEIEISSITADQRSRRIGRLIEELKQIDPGRSDCHQFEEWCLKAIRLIFAGTLESIELHPNKDGRQQRDILATNMCKTPVWTRIHSDYGSRQIVFEIKNYETLTADDYRQINAYMGNDYGSIAFFITRAKNNNLQRGIELDFAQELFFNQNRRIAVKLSSTYLVKHLSKIRNPQKHDSADKELNSLIDTYIRNYLIMKSK